MNVLVIAAHPDDEVLGCGGTMARLAGQGHRVRIAILAEGVTSRFDRRQDADRDALADLHEDARRVGALVGAQGVDLIGLPDNRLDTVPLLDVVKIVERLIEDQRPEVVYTQHGGDLNVDHSLVFRATLTATRPQLECPVRQLFGYEVPSSTEWAFQSFEPVFKPNVFVDISQTLDVKIEAMRSYRSESRPFPHPRSEEAIRAIAQRWGSVSGLPAAEAFELVRWIR